MTPGGNNFNYFPENQLTTMWYWSFNRNAGDFSDVAGEREMAPTREMQETW